MTTRIHVTEIDPAAHAAILETTTAIAHLVNDTPEGYARRILADSAIHAWREVNGDEGTNPVTVTLHRHRMTAHLNSTIYVNGDTIRHLTVTNN